MAEKKFSRKMKTSQEVIDMIMSVTDNFKLKTDLYGIRNKKTNRFIIMV